MWVLEKMGEIGMTPAEAFPLVSEDSEANDKYLKVDSGVIVRDAESFAPLATTKMPPATSKVLVATIKMRVATIKMAPATIKTRAATIHARDAASKMGDAAIKTRNAISLPWTAGTFLAMGKTFWRSTGHF
jgi:hypothetical protein